MYEVRPAGLLLFVPRFHLRSAVRLVDRAGAAAAPRAAYDGRGRAPPRTPGCWWARCLQLTSPAATQQRLGLAARC